ncbi:hypothetical protein [Spirochaeta cellobiosiphila]|uniref:hypothetical protein n=1 Tax=Spirochaeta cellobiosiphila TaxID=504483 RepID=UPI000424805C|nr:hypothetical protein [Spirochaeta cellobiosiphila]
MKKEIIYLLLFVTVLFTGCGGTSSSDSLISPPRWLQGSWEYPVITEKLIVTNSEIIDPLFDPYNSERVRPFLKGDSSTALSYSVYFDFTGDLQTFFGGESVIAKYDMNKDGTITLTYLVDGEPLSVDILNKSK